MMKIGLDTPPVANRPRTLSDDQLDSLARTCDATAAPMWVEDLAGTCVYRNRGAQRHNSLEASASRFEVVDHAGHVVARLASALC